MAASTTRISKGTERALRIRAEHWPDVPEEMLWNRKKCDGYTTIPRTVPLVMNVIDSLSKNQPAGRTYFGLWCRIYDESLLIIENPMSVAFEAGFTGERAVTTWRHRMGLLRDLGFIDSKPGSSGEFHFVLLFNPHKVVWALRNQIQSQMFMQLLDRAVDIGARDMEAPESSTKPGDKPKQSKSPKRPKQTSQ